MHRSLILVFLLASLSVFASNTPQPLCPGALSSSEIKAAKRSIRKSGKRVSRVPEKTQLLERAATVADYKWILDHEFYFPTPQQVHDTAEAIDVTAEHFFNLKPTLAEVKSLIEGTGAFTDSLEEFRRTAMESGLVTNAAEFFDLMKTDKRGKTLSPVALEFAVELAALTTNPKERERVLNANTKADALLTRLLPKIENHDELRSTGFNQVHHNSVFNEISSISPEARTLEHLRIFLLLQPSVDQLRIFIQRYPEGQARDEAALFAIRKIMHERKIPFIKFIGTFFEDKEVRGMFSDRVFKEVFDVHTVNWIAPASANQKFATEEFIDLLAKTNLDQYPFINVTQAIREYVLSRHLDTLESASQFLRLMKRYGEVTSHSYALARADQRIDYPAEYLPEVRNNLEKFFSLRPTNLETEALLTPDEHSAAGLLDVLRPMLDHGRIGDERNMLPRWFLNSKTYKRYKGFPVEDTHEQFRKKPDVQTTADTTETSESTESDNARRDRPKPKKSKLKSLKDKISGFLFGVDD